MPGDSGEGRSRPDTRLSAVWENRDEAYNVRRQPAEIDYGNNVVTTCEYDTRSLRVRRIHSAAARRPKPARGAEPALRPATGGGSSIFDNAHICPEQVFRCDPLYRLLEAMGGSTTPSPSRQ